MFFCENCGAKLPLDARFCEKCGHAVSVESKIAHSARSIEDNVVLFTDKKWANEWKALVSSNQYKSYGIILTNTSDCPDHLKKDFYEVLKRYIANRAEENICYCVLDMATQAIKSGLFNKKNAANVEFDVKVLKEIYEIAAPKYVMIIGDRNCIGSIKWENLLWDGDHGDSDKEVDSDLPYIALDTSSPFENGGQIFKISVGRIPSSAKTGFPEAIAYLENAMQYDCRGQGLNAFALSAAEWEKVSQINFEDAVQDVHTCPYDSFVEEMREEGLNILPKNGTYNLLCFNLHGGPFGHYWVSGDGNKAYSPKCLPSNSNVKYIICTEACYGAKPVIASGDGQSTLVTALSNRCLGFVGSTQIAYGATDWMYEMGDMPMGADTLVGRFASGVAKGLSMGESYMKALEATVADENLITSYDIKTIASFALYGDPSLHLLDGGSRKSSFDTGVQKGFHISLPDVKGTVERRLTAVSAEIQGKVNDLLAHFYDGLSKSQSQIKVNYYSVSGYNGYKAVSKRIYGEITEISGIYISKTGKIEKVYVSK